MFYEMLDEDVQFCVSFGNQVYVCHKMYYGVAQYENQDDGCDKIYHWDVQYENQGDRSGDIDLIHVINPKEWS